MPAADDGLGAVAAQSAAQLEYDATPQSRERAELLACRLGWHACVHTRAWAAFRSSRWQWRRLLTPNLLLIALTITFATCMVVGAVLPEYAPGPRDIPQAVRDRAALLFAICWIPAISYLTTPARRRRPIPFFCVYGVLYSLYYAVTPMFGLANMLVLGTNGRVFNPATDYAAPVNLLLAGWLLLVLGYTLVSRLRFDWGNRMAGLLARPPLRVIQRAALAALYAGLVSQFLQWREWWPATLGGIANLVVVLMQAGLVVLVYHWRRRELTRRMIAAVSFGGVAAIVLMVAGGVTSQLMFVIFAIFVGTWIATPSIPVRFVIAGAVLIATCVAIRGVTTKFREATWWGLRADASVLERATFMVDLLRDRVGQEGAAQTVADGWHVITYRSANVDLLIDVMHRTPIEVPYWNGASYRSLVGAVVPRVFWPDKPEKTLGQEFGHRYHYLALSDRATSINLPVVVEFYINYSSTGVLVGMFMLGMLLKVLENLVNRPGQHMLISAVAAPLLARLLVMECDLSLIFGAIPLQVVSLWVLGGALLWLGGYTVRRALPRPPWYAPLPPRLGGEPSMQQRVGGARALAGQG